MTTIQAIQMNIHEAKLGLNKSRKVICKNEIQKLHVQGSIDFYLNELKDLKYSLNCAIENQSK